MEPVSQTPSIQLNPRPGFVVKTRILDSSKPFKYGVNTKVFINICYDAQVPKPPIDFDPAVVFPLIIDNKWEIPLIVSQEKSDKDKKGQPSYVYDCCVNQQSFHWVQTNGDLRSIVIEWCLESIELLYEMTLEREYSIPKMLSKGELSKTEIRSDELAEDGFQRKLLELKANEAMGLIEELRGEKDKGEDDEWEDLPDLMNIGGGGKKPLIEEISEMKIGPGPGSTSGLEHVSGPASGPALSPVSNSQSGPGPTSAPSLGPALSSSGPFLAPRLGPARISFALQYPQPNVIRIDFAHPIPQLSAFHTTHSIVLQNHDPTFFFTQSSPEKLEIPAKAALSSLRSFYVKPENTLYFFF